MDYRCNEEVTIPVNNILLQGELVIPANAEAGMIFSQTSGRKSPGVAMLADYLHQKNFGTLLFDLLTEEEERIHENRFDIPLLTKRLVNVTKWVEKHPAMKDCVLTYFGTGTGTAAALNASAALPEAGIVVSGSGRPDLALGSLAKVKVPVLMIVGSYDYEVLRLNHIAFKHMKCERELEIVQGATHLFDEEGAMEKVSELTVAWLKRYLHPAGVLK
jgi:pimeloyl-ACP methyl ester carboxylesterase